MSNLPYPKSTSLQAQLDNSRPDMPSCAEMKSSSLIDPFLMSEDKDGLIRMNVLLGKWYEYKLEHPEEISLLEIAKSTSIGKKEDVGDSKQGVLDLFAEMNATPVTVVDASEGYGT